MKYVLIAFTALWLSMLTLSAQQPKLEVTAWLRQANNYMSKDDYKKAKAKAEAVLKIDKNNAEAKRILTKINGRLEQERKDSPHKQESKSTTVSRQQTQRAEARPLKSPDASANQSSKRVFTVNGVRFAMVYVEGGSFRMGTSGGEFPRENPAHNVSVSGFYIGETEVTQQLWQAVMGSNPSGFRGSQLPVETVDYYDCQEFIRKLNSLTGEQFRLPYEAEWEFASRGGVRSQGYKYSGSNTIDQVAWYNVNSGSRSHEVKSKKPNELGIYDMCGNVWEWCEDWFDEDYYSYSPVHNPTGPTDGYSWLNRGGSWKSGAKYCRPAYRGQGKTSETVNYLGLRLAL